MPLGHALFVVGADLLGDGRGGHDGAAKRIGDGGDGHVVVGRSDAATREDPGVRRCERADVGGDPGAVIPAKHHAFQRDPSGAQQARERRNVAVFDLAAQQFVADHEHRGGGADLVDSVGSHREVR